MADCGIRCIARLVTSHAVQLQVVTGPREIGCNQLFLNAIALNPDWISIAEMLEQQPLGPCCQGHGIPPYASRFRPAGVNCTTEGECTARNQSIYDRTNFSDAEKTRYKIAHTWWKHGEALSTFQCPKISACCTVRVFLDNTEETQCAMATRGGCGAGSSIYKSGGSFLGISVQCSCVPLTSNPRRPDHYSKCVGVSDVLTGQGVADEACGNLGACCFDDCCARTSEGVCEQSGGQFHGGVSCKNSPCANLACRSVTFEITVDDDGYMIPQSDVPVELSNKRPYEPSDEIPEEPNPQFPDHEPMCGHYSGTIVVDEDGYMVLEECNSRNTHFIDAPGSDEFSYLSIEADLTEGAFGYHQFESGYAPPEERCHGLG